MESDGGWRDGFISEDCGVPVTLASTQESVSTARQNVANALKNSHSVHHDFRGYNLWLNEITGKLTLGDWAEKQPCKVGESDWMLHDEEDLKELESMEYDKNKKYETCFVDCFGYDLNKHFGLKQHHPFGNGLQLKH